MALSFQRRFFRWYSVGPVVLLLAGGGGVLQYRHAHRPPPLLTVPVTVADMEITVVANGSLQPKHLVNVGAQVSGQLTSLKVKLGDRVSKGQLIAEIDPAIAENALRSSRAALDQLRAQRRNAAASLILAEQNFRREASLVEDGSVSHEDFETAKATLDEQKANVESLDAQIVGAQIAVETNEVNVGYTKIAAPIDGTVVGVVTKEGQTVVSAQTAPTIVLLATLDTMVVTAQISEADVGKVAPGQKVYFTTLGDPDHKYDGTLKTIDPAPENFVDENSGGVRNRSVTQNNSIYYLGRFEIDNADGKLRTGMSVQVNIVLNEAKQALTIPAVALGKRDAAGHDTVQTLKPDGTPETRTVRVGLNNNVTAQILEGLTAQDRVVAGTPEVGGVGNGGMQ